MKNFKHRTPVWSPRTACLTSVAIAAAMVSTGAVAIEMNPDNPDLSVQWSNTVKYNAGWRVEERDPNIVANNTADEGTLSFDKGSMVTSRVDLLTELDVSYKKDMGLRISAALWKDFAFQDDVRFNPAFGGSSSYANNTFSDTTKRFQKEGAEFLDAYVYKNFKLNDMGGEVKIGRQTVLWGESLILSGFSVSDGQGPIDAIKGFVTPGVDAKELLMPIGQISTNLQVSPTVSLAAQYYFEFRNSRGPNGGTYLASLDAGLDGPTQFWNPLGNGKFLQNNGVTAPKQSGDFGLAIRWSPEVLDGGTVGAYYRDFTEKTANLRLNSTTGTYEWYFPENERLLGFSFAKAISGVSVGAELVYRENAVLANAGVVNSYNAPRGNVWTALVNGVKLFGPNALWSQASLIGEIGYSQLAQVTDFYSNFNSCERQNRPVERGCSTQSNSQVAIRFTPQWTAVVPGWDATLNLAWTYGLQGNSPLITPDHGNQAAGSYSVGTTWSYNAKHDFTLAYIDYLATNALQSNGTVWTNGSQRQDRGWLSFTYKGSF